MEQTERSRIWFAAGAALVALPAVIALAGALRLPPPLRAADPVPAPPAVVLHLPLAEPLTATAGNRVIEAQLSLMLWGPSEAALAPLSDAMRFADPALIAALGEALRVVAAEGGSPEAARAALPQAALAAFLAANPAPDGVGAEMLVTGFSHRPAP